MYGRYTKDLGEYAKDEARRLRQLERQRKKDDRARDKVNDDITAKWFRFFSEAVHIKQQWWEFSGTAGQPSTRKDLSSCFVVLATLVC